MSFGVLSAVAEKEIAMDDKREVIVYTNDIIHHNFGGVGFHVFHHSHHITKDHFEQVIAKRWREMNPSFARMNDQWDWSKEMWDEVVPHLMLLKSTGTEVYVTTWNPKDTDEGEERADYAKKVVDNLEYLVRQKGADNIKYYCMTNELSLNKWGSLRDDLPKFKDYHKEIIKELKARKLDIQLLATDASPISYWDTIEWATKNMDDITGVYGGHHYINDYKLEDESFYQWFLSKMKWGADLAKEKNKNFIIGEFGSKQDGRTIDGIHRDVCIYWDTPEEPMVGIQLSEAVIAALNGGIYAMGYWTFTDFPDNYNSNYINKWGMFKWSGNDYSTRAPYYAYGLLTKFFRGNSTVFKVDSSDELLRVVAIQHHDKGTYSLAIVNRNKYDVNVNIALSGNQLNAPFRKYVYDPTNIPWSPYGDLQEPGGKVTMKDSRLTDTVKAGTLNVYTTAYDEQLPASVEDVRFEKTADGKNLVNWKANTEPDFCYYRIFRSTKSDFLPDAEARIGSTIATEFVDNTAKPDQEYHYKITAVDQSGNASK
jgi:hypothetical protein